MSKVKSIEMAQAALAEYLATMMFIFIGAGAVVSSSTWLIQGDRDPAQLVAIALAHGLAISMLVYSTMHISGGHINPAVTVAAALTQRIGMVRAVIYLVAQFAGGVTGAFLLKLAVPVVMEGSLGAHALAEGITPGMGLIIEILLTFVLVFVIFATAIDQKGVGKLAPLAIGFAILVCHLVAVPLTGASMNPARSFGPALAIGAWDNHWVYWVGPFVGGSLAGLFYRWVFMERFGERQSNT